MVFIKVLWRNDGMKVVKYIFLEIMVEIEVFSLYYIKLYS